MILDQFRARLIFGTGRLAGGGYAAQSRRMILACCEASITRFDTAPSYGLGGAEELLGAVAGAAARLHTKVGSQPPPFPVLRGWAKRLRNLAPNSAGAQRLGTPPEPFAGPSVAMDYSPAGIMQSLARSRRLLGRDRLDLVLLHEAEPWQIPSQSLAILEREQAEGGIGQLGFAHSGPALRTTVGWLVQTAPWPGDLEALGGGQGRIFHSVLRALRAAAAEQRGLASELQSVLHELELVDDGEAGRYLAALVWLHRRQPEAGLIFATSGPDRLAKFLDLLDRIAPVR